MRKITWKAFNDSTVVDKEGKTSRDKLLEYLDYKGLVIVLDEDNYYTIGENFSLAILYIEDMHNYANSRQCK